jgi:uncharacterized membrane protein
MNRELTFLGGVGLGCGLMYLWDPDQGRRRRVLFRDQVRHLLNETDDALGVLARDLCHRSSGWVAEAGSLIHRAPVSDATLVERVRSRLGRAVSHPRAVTVTAANGRVTLSGPILVHEVSRLLATVSSVPGVTGVDNRLTVHEQAGDIPDLQGGVERTGESRELMQANWSPTARFLVGAAGGGLLTFGLTQRAPLACAIGTVGLGFLARAFTNRPLADLVGLGEGRRLIDVQKTIHIAAPVDRVFEFWSRYENFPRFMSHVREVRPEPGTRRSHWVVAGPAGVPVSYNTEITQFVPNEVVAWRTVPGSAVAHEGSVRFEAAPEGGTRLTVRMSYYPPGGALGHAVAALFGSDPKQAFDDDLMRLQSLIKGGKTSAHGEQVTRKDLVGAAQERGFPAAAP